MLQQLCSKILESYIPIAKQQHFAKNSREDQPLRALVDQHTQHLNPEQKQRIGDEFFGLGPLRPLVGKKGLREILVLNHEHIYWEDGEGLHLSEDSFYSPLTYRNFIQRFCKRTGIVYSLKKPFANGEWESFRIHLVAKPIVENVQLTLRKHLSEVLSLETYRETEICTDEQLKIMQQIVAEKRNFLIVGGTSSGKTTLLNSLIAEVGPDRIVAIEDTSELKMPNTASVKMLTSEMGWCQEKLVQQSLRMRPDRIAMGEVRGGEAKDFLQALATGHRGSMGTLHGDDAQQALYRLEMLVQMGCPQWSLESVRRLISLSLDHIIVIRKEGRHRKIKGIYQLKGLESFGFLFQKLDGGSSHEPRFSRRK